MTAYDYSRPLSSANRMLTRYGQLGAIRRPGTTSGPAYDPVIGEPPNEPARIVILDYMAQEIDGTRILATDKKALVAPGSLSGPPTVEDLLVEQEGGTFAIVAVETLKPAETALLFTLQLRR